MKILTFILVLLLLSYSKNQETPLQTNSKVLAFQVLKTKCNVCHATKKRTDIFTLANMDSLASDIHMQVFTKKKMPKGRKVTLTEAESKALQDWLDQTIAKPK